MTRPSSILGITTSMDSRINSSLLRKAQVVSSVNIREKVIHSSPFETYVGMHKAYEMIFKAVTNLT